MARVGEILKCRRRHLVLASDLLVNAPAVFLCLETSKTATRGRPKVQHLHVDDPQAMALITLAFESLGQDEPLYPLSPAAFRSRWDKCLAGFGLQGVITLTPGGLRRGGSYHHALPITDIQWRMRLKHQHTLEYYLQDVSALSALTGVANDSKLRIKYASTMFEFLAFSST